jgi:hypothetical protein
MNTLFQWHFWPLFIMIWIMVIAVSGCQEQIKGPPITSWDSPRLLEIQKEWQSLLDTAMRTQGKKGAEKYGLKNEKLYKMLHDIIEKQLSKDDRCRLALSCGTLPVRSQDQSAFNNAVLSHIIDGFIILGDRDMLVNLLATRFPRRLCQVTTIEFALVIRRGKLKDPILVLGEAYAKCQIPEVRHDIAAAVRRGFTDFGIRGKNDAEFVTNAMQWYEKNKDNLDPNGFYAGNEDFHPLESYEEHPEYYEKYIGHRELLFKQKDGK